MPNQHPRGDEPLIRHVAETHTLQAAQAWQRLPYILLPENGFGQYLAQHTRELQEAMPLVEHLPWDDALYDLLYHRTAFLDDTIGASPVLSQAFGKVDRGHCWLRISSGQRYLRRQAVTSPWLTGPRDLLEFAAPDPDTWLAVEVWESEVLRPDGTRGFPSYPDVTLVPVATPWDYGSWAHLYTNPLCRVDRAYGAGFCNLARCPFPSGHPKQVPCVGSEVVMSAGGSLALLALAYLVACDQYLVEVTPAAAAHPPTPKEQRQEKIAEQKPWLRRDLPHYILIDPQQAAEYRQSGTGEKGTHAAPLPHGRRGHWRTLRHERYHVPPGEVRRVFVKPTWIGALEWQSSGQRYRVAPPRTPQTPEEVD